jgi:hypothetical protein
MEHPAIQIETAMEGPKRERSPQNEFSSLSRDSLFQAFRWEAFLQSPAGFEHD